VGIGKAERMDISIEQLSEAQIEAMAIRSWPVWEKEVSTFDWHYDMTEQCLLLEGQVTVKIDTGTISFGKGDFVTFSQGLSCEWDIVKSVRKHYNFV